MFRGVGKTGQAKGGIRALAPNSAPESQRFAKGHGPDEMPRAETLSQVFSSVPFSWVKNLARPGKCSGDRSEKQ